MQQFVLFIVLGLTAGILSGLIGIGGGVIIVPVLIFLCGFSQHTAQGTTLAMLVPPIGILGAWMYYKSGYVDIKVAVLIGVGFFLGSFLGAQMATRIPNIMLERIFGFAMLGIAVKMLFAR